MKLPLTLVLVAFADFGAALLLSHPAAHRGAAIHRPRVRDITAISTAQKKPISAAIVGGGLGGLAAAIALRKVGVDAHVYERATELKATAGTGLTLWPNGLSALAAIDPELIDLVLESGAATQSIEVTTADGLTRLPNPTGDPRRFPKLYGHPMLNIHWAKLQQLLASRLPADRLHFDHSFDRIEELSLIHI